MALCHGKHLDAAMPEVMILPDFSWTRVRKSFL